MRTLRYWLGLPLYNVLLWLAYILFCYNDVLKLGDYVLQDNILVCLFLSTLVCPLLTALYYPVGREDCRPLYAVVLKSGAVIFAVCFLTLAMMDINNIFDFETMGIDALFSLILAVIEMAGYWIGLIIANAVSNAALRKPGGRIKNA